MGTEGGWVFLFSGNAMFPTRLVAILFLYGFFQNPRDIQLISTMFVDSLSQGLKGTVVGQYPGFTAIDNH